MITSTDFFAKVLAATKTDKSHGRKFHQFTDDHHDKNTRFDNFKRNMKRLGRKFDLKACVCNVKYEMKFEFFVNNFDVKNPTGKISFAFHFKLEFCRHFFAIYVNIGNDINSFFTILIFS